MRGEHDVRLVRFIIRRYAEVHGFPQVLFDECFPAQHSADYCFERLAARLQHALTQVLRIALEGPFMPETASAGLKALLVRAAKADDFSSLEVRLCAAQRSVREIFARICC